MNGRHCKQIKKVMAMLLCAVMMLGDMSSVMAAGGIMPAALSAQLSSEEGSSDASAETAQDKLQFTAVPSYQPEEGEELPEGAQITYTYSWQYAERKYDRWGNEQELTEADWKTCVIGGEEKPDGTFNPFCTAAEQGVTAEDGSSVGRMLLVSVPDGIDRRTQLSKMTVRCVVGATVQDGEGNELEELSKTIVTNRTNIRMDAALLACDLTVTYTENTALTVSAPDLSYEAVPAVANAPVDSDITYTYTWQYYDTSGWRGQWRDITYRNSPLKNAVVSDGTLMLTLPATIAERKKLDGLRVQCKVTATADGYTIGNSPTGFYEFGTVSVDSSLLQYGLLVRSDNTAAQIKDASDILSFKVTPALSGADASFNNYQYDWQYLDAEGNWTSISRSDENCPLRYATSTSGADSVLSMPLPENVDSRRALNQTKVRCVVSVNGVSPVNPPQVIGEEAVVEIAPELLTEFSLIMTASPSNSSRIDYPGQSMSIGYETAVDGLHADEAVIKYIWEYKAKGASVFQPLSAASGIFQGGVFSESGNSFSFNNTGSSNKANLKAMDGATIRCTAELYANGDAAANGDPYEISRSKEVTVSINEALISEYGQSSWLQNAWLEVDAINELNTFATGNEILTVRATARAEADEFNLPDGAIAGDYALGVDPNYGGGYQHVWEYRENGSEQWKPISTLESAVLDYITITDGTDDTENTSVLEIELPETYAGRMRLTGMSFRCISSAIATANHLSEVTRWGFISASTPDDAFTVLVNPKLLRSQASSTRRIIGFLTAEEAERYLADPENFDVSTAQQYDYTKSYLVEYFADGVREERATANFPESVVAIYEYQVEKDIETVETKLGAVEIPVPWRFIVQNGKQYNLSSTKAEYRYDAVFAQIIPQWNAEELQKYIDEHPDPNALDYDEDDAVKWVIAAGLNGRFPHIKVCWNTELKGLANNADYVKYNGIYGASGSAEEKAKVAELAGAPNNPYWKQTYSDWFFKSNNEFNGDLPTAAQKAEGNNEAAAEAEQLAWLNAHYGTVKVMMDDVRSEESDPTPVVMELPVTWEKYTVDEYDTASQSMTARWMGGAAVANMQGARAPAAKWVWRAKIDAVEQGQYVLADAFRYTNIEANIYWSRVIDSIVGALISETDAATTSFVALSNAAQLSSKIPTALRVELKDANGGLNITDTITIDGSNWKLIEGSVYDASQQYHWRVLNANAASIVDEVGTGSAAGFVAIEPTLSGYTFTENADTEMARVWYQWGTIITGLKKDGGADFDAIAAAKTPIIKVPTIGGTNQSAVTWGNLLTQLNKPFGVTLLDKSNTTGFKQSTITPSWTQPAYDATAPAGRIQPAAQFERPASGVVFGEDLVREFNGREPYGEISWNINPPSKTSGSTNFIKYNIVSNQPHVTGAAGQKTVYADKPWECYYTASSSPTVSQKTTNFGAQDVWQDAGESVKYMVKTSERGGGAFVEYSVTFRNDSTGTRYVGLSYGSDVMIHNNDRAPLTVTSNGIKMEEASGDMCQFNINTTTATAGISVSADGYWIGVYSGRQHWQSTVAGDGNKKINANGEAYVTGIDSGLTFSWVPQKHPLAPGESVTFTCQFGIGKMSEPPRIVPHYDSGSGRSTNVTLNGSNLDISAWMAGEAAYPLRLYYVLDEGLPTQQSEASLGNKVNAQGVVSAATFRGYSAAQQTAYFRTGTENHFVNITGTVEKPRDWVAGEYHSITVYGLSDAGLMTDSVRFPLYVDENEDGEEIFVEATDATVNFNRGAGSGTAPASQTAHMQEPIVLPKGDKLTPPSGQKFVGWSYTEDNGKTTIYPAENYFYVEKNPTTLTARYIPTSQTMYLVETYMQNASGDYEQEDTEVRIDTATSGNIVFTPDPMPGYTVNTSKSKLSVTRNDGAIVQVYYDINHYDVVYNLNGAPGGDENGIFKTVQVAYGGNVSGVPNAAALNAGQNNQFFRFRGWFENADPEDPGNIIDTDTVVDETTLDTIEPGGKLIAYAHWQPLGNAQATFDYNYQNHAQGASRSDKIALDPIVSESGRYGYSSKPRRLPATPSAWKDTEGKVYTFLEWRLVENGEMTETVVTKDTILPNYENVTIKALWTESYSVSRSSQGDGTIWDINDPAGGERSYAPGDTVDIRWRANPGSYVQHVYIDNVLSDDLIKNGGWHLEDIRENHSVYVVFGFGEGDSGIEEETTYNITATPVGGVAFDVPERGGTYKAQYGEDYTVKWRISPGYTLSSVTINGLPMDISESDNSYTFNNIHIDQEIKVTAVRGSGGISGGGTVNRGPYTISTKIGRGTEITPNQTVAYGDSSTITWKVPYGFVVDSVLINRVPLATPPQNNTYVFRNVTQNSSIIVMCKPDPSLPPDTIYVTTTIDDHGSITPTTPIGQLAKGDNHTVTWSADSGYYVSAVYIDNVLQKTDSGANKIFYSYTFTNLQTNHDVVVEVKPVESSGGDTPAPALHAITTSMENGGTIDKPGSVPNGSDVTVTWRMAPNHRVVGVYLDGELVDDYNAETNGNSYTLRNITAAHALKVVCERVISDIDLTGKHIVTTTINLGASDGQKIVNDGESCTVSWTPPKGYHVSSLKVDGVEQSYVDGNSWTIDHVTKDITIAVTVEKDSEQNYKIAANIVNGGTVSGGGTVNVGKGAILRWTVADGFRVSDITIDGVSVSGIDLENDRSYSFPASQGAAGQTYQFNVICTPKLYYHVRPTGTGCENLSASADPYVGDAYTVSWKAAEGYRFKSVTVNGTEVTPVLRDGVYSYTFDSSNTAANGTYQVEVLCDKIRSYTITTGRNSGGVVSASKTLYETDADKSYTVTWSASSGYRVKAVTVDGVPYTGESYVFNYEDGKDVTLRVEFEPQKYYTVKAIGKNTGITAGNGTYTIDTDTTVKWTAPEGFVLSSVTIDGAEVTVAADQTEYTFDHTTGLTAGHTYEIIVTYVAEGAGGEEPEEPDQFYTVQTAGVFTRTISESAARKLGEDYLVLWTVLDGYQLQSVKVNGTAVTNYTAQLGGYSLLISGADKTADEVVTVEVICEKIQPGQPGGGGSVITPYSVYAYTNDAALGTVTPSAATLKEDGAEAAVKWDAKQYCHIVSVTVSDYPDRSNPVLLTEEQAAAGVYTFAYDDHTDKIVDVVFERDPQYAVSSAAAGNLGEGCTVTGSGVLKQAGDECTVSWTVSAGYRIESIVVADADGQNAQTLDAAAMARGSLTLRYADLSADRKVTVTYEKNKTGNAWRTVHAQVNDAAMGTVTPSVKSLTAAGSTCSIAWTANPGFRVRSVIVSNYPDGSDARALSREELAEGQYTFAYNDGKDQHVYVVFEQDPAYEISIIGVDGGAGSTVTGGKTLTASGQSHMVTWAAGAGYQVKSVVIANTDGTNAQTLSAEEAARNSYTFEYDTMTASRKVTVTFEKAIPSVYSVVTSVNDESMGWISPSADLYAEGAEYTVSWGAHEGYYVKSVTVNGADYTGNTYTFRYSGHQDVAVQVVYEKYPEFVISTEKVGGGANSSVRSGATLTRSGETYAVTWSADSAFKVDSVVITDAAQQVVKTLSETEIAAGKYTFAYDQMSSDQKLTVVFATDTSSGGGAGTLPYSVTTSVNDEAMGSIDPSATLRRPDAEYTVTWSAKPGYQVKSVTIDGQTYTRAEGNLPSSYTFKYNDHKDVAVSAVFEQEPQYVITTEQKGNGGAGSFVSDGAVLSQPGQAHTATWFADEGFHVKSVVVSKPDGSDRITLDAAAIQLGSYTFTYEGVGASDRKLVVTFEKDEDTTPGGGGSIPATPYTVTTSVNDETMGTVSPSMTLKEAGATYEVTWSAHEGYYVKSVSIDGRGYAPGSYTFAYDEYKDVTVKVTFAPNQEYTASAVMVGGGAGSRVLPASGTLSESGDTHTVKWTADEGYKATSAVVTNAKGKVVWTCDETELAAGQYTFSYDEMTSDQTITVTFTKENADAQIYAINTSVNDAAMGWVSPSVTLRAAGESTITWGANTGYRVKKVTISDPDGGNAREASAEELASSRFVFRYADKKDLALHVELEPIPSYEITVEKIGGGAKSTAEPASAVLSQTGDRQTVTWNADTGYHVESVVISRPDGSDRTVLDAAAIAAGSHTFTYASMGGSDRKITITFKKDETPGGLTAVPYSIGTSKIGSGIVTAPKTLYHEGETHVVAWTPEAGWHVAEVTINGVPYRGADNQIPTSYEFKYDDHRDAALIVTFAENDKRTITTAMSGVYGPGSRVSEGGTLKLDGQTHTVTWTAEEGYEVVSVTDSKPDGSDAKMVDAASGSYTYQYEALDSDRLLTVTFAKQEGTPVYSVITGVNDTAMGTVTSGATLKASGETAEIVWSAKPGYHVREVVYKLDGAVQADAPASPYTFRYDDGHDAELYVVFERNTGYTVNVNPVGSGTAANPKTMYGVGEQYEVWWKPNEGAELVSVTVSGYAPLGESKVLTADDWTYDAVSGRYGYTFEYDKMAADATIDIVFKDKDYYYITTSAQNVQSITAAPEQCELTQSSTIQWTPAEGAVLQAIKIDGVSQAITDPNQTELIFTPDSPAANQIYLIEVIYELQTEEEPAQPEYRINVSKEGSGTVTGAGILRQEDADSENHAVTWTAAEGWHVSKVVVDRTRLSDEEAASGSYTVKYSELTGDVNIKVVFERDQIIAPPAEENRFTVSTEYEGNGTISNGATLSEGEEPYTVTWAAGDGWYVKSAQLIKTEDGTVIQSLDESSYLFSYETGQNVTVKVVFEKEAQYSITAVIDAGGSISPAAATLRKGDAPAEIIWSISDSEKFSLKSVTINGTALSASEYTKADGSYGYTFVYDDLFAAGMPENIVLKVELDEAEQPAQPQQYLISTGITPSIAGTISAAAMVAENGSYIVTWNAKSDYRVTKIEVTENGTTRELTAADSGLYAFTNVTGNCSIMVSCEERSQIDLGGDERFYEIVTGINGGSMDDGKTVRSVREGDSYTVSWTPDPGSYVASVVVDGAQVPVCTEYTFSDISSDHTVQVTCLSMAVSEIYYVDVTPGSAIASGNCEVQVGTDHTVTWRPAAGEHIVSVTVNDQPVDIGNANTGGSYTITGAAKDEVFHVVITSEQNADTPEEEVYFDVAVTAKNCTVSGQTHVKAGESTTIAWEPEFGYEVKSIIIDDSARPVTLESFTFDAMSSDHSVIIVCERIGSEDPDPEAVYTISTRITDGGTITAPVTVSTPEEKQSQTIAWSAPEGFRVAQVKIDGVQRPELTEAGSVTFTDIAADHSVDVECRQIEKHTITVSNDNGTISAAPALVEDGGSSVVTWSGMAGFVLKSVQMNGISLSADAYTDHGDGSYSLTLQNVISDHVIVVEYEPDASLDPGNTKNYIYTHIDHGTITPTVTLTSAADRAYQKIEWTVAEGYRITKVLVDDQAVSAAGMVELTNIAGDHTVSVECEKIPAYTVATDAKNVTMITPTKTDIPEGSAHSVSWKHEDNLVLKVFKVDNVEVALAEGITSYEFTDIRENHTVYVEYGPEDEPEKPDKVEISVMVTNGTKTGGGTLNYGTKSHTVTWTPNAGYEVKSVIIDSVAMAEEQIKKTGDSLTFTDITGSHSIVVVCEIPKTGEDPEPDEKVYLEANIINGTFEPDNEFGVYELEKGTDFEISWTPQEGYHVVSVKLDQVERPDLLADGRLKLIGISGDHVLTVECRDEEEEPNEGPFTITTSIDHGSISESFTTDEEHSSYTVSWTADSRYEIVSVMVDGNPYANAADGYIDFNPIRANHTVDVRSQLKDQPVNTHVINVVVDNGGTHAVIVDGNPAEYVEDGGSAKATWQAADGYDVTRIVIDGVSYNSLPGCDAQKGEYTFNNVTKDHEIIVYTGKHVEKEPVYYGITILPHGDPSGLELSESLPSVLEGTEIAVTWKAKPGWQIDKVTRNNNIMSAADMAAGMTEDGFTFTVNANNDFVVYVSKQGPADDSFVTVTTEINSGWISNGGSVKKGSSFEVAWRPGDGYTVDQVTITDADGNKTVLTEGLDNAQNWKHTLDSITANTLIQVSCVKQPDDEPPLIYSYQIDTQATNGVITGGGTVTAGTDREITWAAADGCSIKSVMLYEISREDGSRTEMDISDAENNRYTIRNIDADYLVVLICENEMQSDDDFFYDIYTQITNGTINGPFLNLRKADQAVVSWTPAEDCYVKAVLVDGKAVSIPADHQLEVLVEGDDHVVEVICEKKKPVEIPDDVTPYTIETYIYDGLGEITPKTAALPGSDVTVQWKGDANNHYKVDRVYVDGKSIEIPSNNMFTFTDLDQNHKIEVYLAENLVNVEVSYEGNGEVVKSGTVYWGENFGIVRGLPNEGYRLESVILNGKLLQQGEIIPELLPDPDMPLPGEPTEEEQPAARMLRRAGRRLAAPTALLSARAEDYTKFTENEFQNTFYFRDVTQQQSVKYVFVDNNGTSDYAPYQVNVELVDGRGEREVAKNVAAGSDTSIGWTLDEGYYVDHISVVRNNLESDINDLEDANLQGDSRVGLTNVQANTTVKVYLKRGTPPDPQDANDFSLSIDVVGPGSNDPDIRVYGAGRGMAAGAHEASWAVGDHKVTMVKVDGAVREDLIGKTSTVIQMNREDVKRDHHVIVYLDGVVLPGLEKQAGGSGATVGDVIPYTISVWNDTDQAIWENVTLSDVIPAGLKVDTASMKLYRVNADGSKTQITSVLPVYDAATRTISASLGDMTRADKFELDFNAEVEPEAAGQDIGNSVKAVGTNSGTTDRDPQHIVEAVTEKVYPGGTTSVLPKAPAPHLTKTVSNNSAHPEHTRVGDTLTYTIDAWNSEPGSVWKNVKIKDDVPEGLEVLESSIELSEIIGSSKLPAPEDLSIQYDAVNRSLTVNLGDVQYNQHYQISFKALVLPEAVGNDIGNVALAAGTAPDKTPVSEETAPVYPSDLDKPDQDGVLPAAPAPLVEKTAHNLDRTDEQSKVGDTIEYTLTVKNTKAGSTWKDAVLRDRIPEGLELDTANIVLRTPDGDITLDAAVYDETSRIISVYLGEVTSERPYQLVFTAKLVGSPQDYNIGNIAWANGKDPSLPGSDQPTPGVDENTEPGDPYFPPEDDWVDEGGPTTEKVYPDEKDRPLTPGPKLTKTSRNLTHPASKLEIGDVLEYELEIANTQPGSVWRNVTVTDTLPEQLALQPDGWMLIHPDGTVEPLQIENIYDEETHSFTVVLPEAVLTGGTYWLRYQMAVSGEGLGDAPVVDITNKATATGTDIDGHIVAVEAADIVQYEKPAAPEEPVEPKPQEPENSGSGGIQTGDSANAAPYLVVLLTAVILLAVIVILRVQKSKKK